MKRLISTCCLVLLSVFSTAGCAQKPEPPSRAEEILRGEHALRKMSERANINSSLSGGFFLFLGSVNAQSHTSVDVQFSWQMNDGTWAISSLPLTKFRVQFDESKQVPTIKFRWRSWRDTTENPQPQILMNAYVVYALITCREKDWPVNIQLPLNK